jgi:hypothetical protein
LFQDGFPKIGPGLLSRYLLAGLERTIISGTTSSLEVAGRFGEIRLADGIPKWGAQDANRLRGKKAAFCGPSFSRPTETALFADAAQVNDFQYPASRTNPMLEEWYYLDNPTNYPSASYYPHGHFRHSQMPEVGVRGLDGSCRGIVQLRGAGEVLCPEDEVLLPARCNCSGAAACSSRRTRSAARTRMCLGPRRHTW